MSSATTDKIVQDMLRERDAFAQFSRDKLSKMDSAIQARLVAIEGFNFSAPISEESKSDKQEVSSDFVGLAYPAVVHRVLSLQPERSAMTVNDIVEVMKLHGVVPDSRDPRHTVQTALNRRKTKEGDVVHTGLGEWGLRSWYTESDLAKFALALNGANARDAKSHKEAMKKGIEATKARGAHYGKPPKITEEMWNLAIKLICDDGLGITYVHGEVIKLTPPGVDPIGLAALSNRKKQFLAREPYPPRWKTYFDQKKREADAQAEVLGKGNVVSMK